MYKENKTYQTLSDQIDCYFQTFATSLLSNYDSVLGYFQGDLIVHADGRYKLDLTCHCTGKSLSEALIFASTNPQYDDRLFIELRVQYLKIASSEHTQNIEKQANLA